MGQEHRGAGGDLFRHTRLFNVQYKIMGNIMPIQIKKENGYSSSIVLIYA